MTGTCMHNGVGAFSGRRCAMLRARKMATDVRPELKRFFLSTPYKDAVTNAFTFNKKLQNERDSRIPFYDNQTNLIQRVCHLWRSPSDRRKGRLPGQVYSYMPRRWKLVNESEQVPDRYELNRPKAALSLADVRNSSTPTPSAAVAGECASAVSGTKRSSRTTESSRSKGEGRSNRYRIDDTDSEDDAADGGDGVLEEEESDEEVTIRKKPKRTRPSPANPTRPKREASGTETVETPYFCKECNRYYKTQPALKAHITKYHGGSVNNNNSLTLPPAASTTSLSDAISSPPHNEMENRAPKVISRRSSNSSSVSTEGDAHREKRSKAKLPPHRLCDFCLGDSTMNKKLCKPEKMVACSKCGRSAHLSCLQLSPDLAAIVMTYPWECIECKSCAICTKSDNEDQLLFCDDCDRGYHMFCVRPPLKEPPEGSWSCDVCLHRLGKK